MFNYIHFIETVSEEAFKCDS